MFDSIFNLIIISIPLAIFIGRLVSRSRNKRHPPPKPPQPYIPVHFEDDEDPDEFKYFDKKPEPAKSSPPPRYAPESHGPLTAGAQNRGISARPVRKTTATAPVSPRRESFSFNLNHLSPMKQAVVMAEILGPPKGLV